jgi:eukaryotic-like serine/threonine-protein kinase
VSPRRLTLEEAFNSPTAWTADSKTILFDSDRYGQSRIYKQDIDKETAEFIVSGRGSQQHVRMSPDGRWMLYLLYDDTPGQTKMHLMRIPQAGGTAQEILSDDVNDFSCSHIAGRACVITELRGKTSVFSLLDPVTGRAAKVLETSVEAGSPAISPDGQHIAFVLPGAPRNRIRIVNLHGGTEGEIAVSGAELLYSSLEWSADGTGFFSGDIHAETTRLLHIERNGVSQVVWTQPTTIFMMWGIPSPDGRYLATFKGITNSNVWMVENPSPPHT